MKSKGDAYVCQCGEGFSDERGLHRHAGRHALEDGGALEQAAESPT